VISKSAANFGDIEHSRSSGSHSRIKVILVLDVRHFAHADSLITELNAVDVSKVHG